MKKTQLALAIGAALTLSFPQASVFAATVDGGAGIEITYDDTGVDSTVQLSADLAMLDNVSATYLPVNVIAILTPELVAMIPVEAMPGLTAEQIAEFTPEAVAALSVEQIKEIKPMAMAGFNAEQIGQLSLDAVTALSAEQVANLSADAIGGFTVEQFNQLTLAALEGLSAVNMGGMSADLIETLGLELLLKLNIDTFKKMPTGDLVWFLVNLNPTLVTPEQVVNFLPFGWSIDLKSGKLKIPHGKKLKLKKFKHKKGFFPIGLIMPTFSDLSASISLGGNAVGEDNILTEIEMLLKEQGYDGFSAIMTDTGMLKVSGQGTEFSFLADMDEVEQLEEGSTPELKKNEDGNYVLIMSSGLKLTLLTAPKDPLELFNLIPGGELKMDKKGNIKLKLPKLGRSVIGTFDPLILTAPAGAAPGVIVSGTPGVDEVAQVVYSDGTMQILRPSVTSATGTIWSAGFYGTGKIKFKSNGHINYINSLNMPWNIVPSLDVIVNYSAPPLFPYYIWAAPEQMLYVDKEGSAQLLYWNQIPTQ